MAKRDENESGVEQVLVSQVEAGLIEFAGVSDDGEFQYRLTERGMAYTEELMRRMGLDPDDPDAALEAIRRMNNP